MKQKTLTPDGRDRLIGAARAAARRSYSPYSRFRVGAAVRTAKGVYTGTNVENASYGLSLCAERAALAAAVSAGAGPIEAVSISCIDADPDGSDPGVLMPCGACRQWLVELAPDAQIVIDGVEPTFVVQDLLPRRFTLHTRRARRTTGGRSKAKR
jgi:cytidine deaminase